MTFVVYFMVILISVTLVQSSCYYEEYNTTNTEVCVSIEDLNLVHPEKKRLYVIQTSGNFDWAVIKRRYPNLRVSVFLQFSQLLLSYKT